MLPKRCLFLLETPMLITPVRGAGEAITPILDLLTELDRRTPQSIRNLRSDERRPFRRPITILPLSTPNAPLQVTARDISTKGLGVVSMVPLRVGEHFVFAFDIVEVAALVLCRVRHGRAIRQGYFLLGTEFEDAVKAVPGAELFPLRWLGLQVDAQGFSKGLGLANRCTAGRPKP